MKIPKKILVGGKCYRIIKNYSFKETSLWGQADHNTLEIRLSGGLASIQLEEVFLHEIIHCVDEIYLNRKLSEDEINGFSQGMFQVLNTIYRK